MNDLIAYLEAERDKKFTFEGVEPYALARRMMAQIGHPDAHVRDDVIYPALAHLLHDNHMEKDQLNAITNELLGDAYLFHDMDNNDANAVLIRSFTTLQLVILVFVHRRDKLFDKDTLSNLLDRFLAYFRQETVLEGYDPVVGWKHAIAHGADLFHQLMQVEEYGSDELQRMWDVVAEKFLIDHYQYVSDEPERMATALEAALKRNLLDETYLTAWVDKLYRYEKTMEFPARYHIKWNTLSLLRSLYFRVVDQDVGAAWKDHLKGSCMNYR